MLKKIRLLTSFGKQNQQKQFGDAMFSCGDGGGELLIIMKTWTVSLLDLQAEGVRVDLMSD